ncbi:hypothetical protein HPB51_005672 [Rhipicephalus microplus]|uniref:Uncharacterized protein n=1 Tax=Rhipicephalus microplus TaxID=6941 RepID=A0A9J6EXX9_RHIMP|nr:hypothetical protein HPB51_005672 [Rhipicephalus microplus]
METGVIAGNLHFHQPNPDIPYLHNGTIEIVDKATPFPGGLVGINSFGFGETNASVILERVPGAHRTMDRINKDGPYPDSANALLNNVGQPDVTQFPYRGYMLVPVIGNEKELFKSTTETSSMTKAVWFVFTGVGCQWKGMAQQMVHFDVFARSIQRSQEALKQVGMDLIEMLTTNNDDETVGVLYGCIAAVEVS